MLNYFKTNCLQKIPLKKLKDNLTYLVGTNYTATVLFCYQNNKGGLCLYF